MSLEGIVLEYRQPPYQKALDEYNRFIREVASYVKQTIGREIPLVMTQGRLEDIASGGVIYRDGRTEGNAADIAGANRLRADYQRFKSTQAGRELIKRYGDVDFDGFVYDDLAKYSSKGNRALFAVIEVNGNKYLAINKRYANSLGDLSKLYGLAHEHVHGTGDRTEGGTENKLKKTFSDLADKARGYWKEIYQRLAGTAALREQHVY